MEFSNTIRKNKYISFYKDVNTKIKKTSLTDNINGFFKNKKLLASGREGVIYLSNTTHLNNISISDFVRTYTQQEAGEVIIKMVDLQSLVETKGIHPKILNKNPLFIYNLFYSLTRNVSMPSLIENICFILTNQLVFQNICPHFVLNYYWEYYNNTLIYYNEYANYSTLFHWGKTNHTYQEWMNILCQIIISIISMQKYFNIIHGDLHTLNILIYKVKKGGYWKYIIDKDEYIIPNLGYIILLSDFGFASIPGKVYVKWYFDDTIKNLTRKQQIFFDFKYLSDDLIKQKQPVQNLLQESLQKINSQNYSKKYNLISLLNDYYEKIDRNQNLNKEKNDTFIEIYNLNKPLNTELLPLNFKHLSTF
jgi:hypothetical protein